MGVGIITPNISKRRRNLFTFMVKVQQIILDYYKKYVIFDLTHAI